MQHRAHTLFRLALLFTVAFIIMGTSQSAQAAQVNIAAIVGDEVITTVDVEQRRDLIMATAGIPNTIENQIRAQLAWNKVVARKLRRNVTVAQDEVVRAQKSAATAPGEEELRMQAIEIKYTTKESLETARRLAGEMALQLKAGSEMSTVAAHYTKQAEVAYNPPVWVPMSTLPQPLQQGMRAMKSGDVTPPILAEKSLQLIQLLDRATGTKQADTTEYAIKQITLPLPVKRDKASIAKLQAAAKSLHDNFGSCDDETLPVTGMPATAQIVRMKLAAMSPQQRSLLSHLEVGDVSDPLTGPDAVRLIVMCEKVEPSVGNLPDAEAIRQQLFAEKLELEAQKHLRNLRRDAFIDIKGAQQ